MPAARRRQEEPDDDLDRGAHQEQGGGSSWSDDQLGDEGADALKNERGDSKRPPAGLTFSLLAAQVEEHDSGGGKRDAQVGGRPDALMKDEDGQRGCQGGTQSCDRRNSPERASTDRFCRYAKSDCHEAGEAEGRQQLG